MLSDAEARRRAVIASTVSRLFSFVVGLDVPSMPEVCDEAFERPPLAGAHAQHFCPTAAMFGTT